MSESGSYLRPNKKESSKIRSSNPTLATEREDSIRLPGRGREESADTDSNTSNKVEQDILGFILRLQKAVHS